MTSQPPLWLPSERHYTTEPPPAPAQAAADEQAFRDIHGQQSTPRAYRTTVTVHAPEEYL
ncbi:hypothetical protein ACFXJO_05715 [Streptomyces lavendulae]|uniref:hypothetical protein n=1 Tax=Streptomyces lavendulae TaxID=1914 RepID=UPI00369BFC7C